MDRRQRLLSGFSSRKNHLAASSTYVKSENVLGNGSLIRRRSIAESKREDVLPVLPLVENCNAGQDDEDLLNAGCRRWPRYIVRALAKRAIRMSRTVGMDVSKLCRGSKKEKDREDRNEQNAGWRILRPYFADPSHNYCSIYIRLAELPMNERPPGVFPGSLGDGKSARTGTSKRRISTLSVCCRSRSRSPLVQ